MADPVADRGPLLGWSWFDLVFSHEKIVAVKDLNPGASRGAPARSTALHDIAWWTTGYTRAGWALAAMLIAGLTGVSDGSELVTDAST